MARVKFSVNTEYAYLQNFKILQSTSFAAEYYTQTSGSQTLLTSPQQTALQNTRLNVRSMSSNLSNARCKIILNSCNGRRNTGINTILEEITMRWGDGKVRVPLQLPLPLQLQLQLPQRLVHPVPVQLEEARRLPQSQRQQAERGHRKGAPLHPH